MGEANQSLITKGEFLTDQMVANAKYGNWQAFWQEVVFRRRGDLSGYKFDQQVLRDIVDGYCQDDLFLQKIVDENQDAFLNNFLNDLKTADFESQFFLRPLFLFESDQLERDFRSYFFFRLKNSLKNMTEEEINQEFFDFENQLIKTTNQKMKSRARREYLEVLAATASIEGIFFKGIGIDGPDFLFEKIDYQINEQLTIFTNKTDQLRDIFRTKLLEKLLKKSDLPGGIDTLIFLESYQGALIEIGSEYFQKARTKREAIDLLNDLKVDKEAVPLKKELIELIKAASSHLDLKDLFFKFNQAFTNPASIPRGGELRDVEAMNIAILSLKRMP